MINVETKVRANGAATAVLTTEGNGVAVLVDPAIRWDAEGLLALAETLKGMAAIVLLNMGSRLAMWPWLVYEVMTPYGGLIPYADLV